MCWYSSIIVIMNFAANFLALFASATLHIDLYKLAWRWLQCGQNM